MSMPVKRSVAGNRTPSLRHPLLLLELSKISGKQKSVFELLPIAPELLASALRVHTVGREEGLLFSPFIEYVLCRSQVCPC